MLNFGTMGRLARFHAINVYQNGSLAKFQFIIVELVRTSGIKCLKRVKAAIGPYSALELVLRIMEKIQISGCTNLLLKVERL